MKLQLGIFLGGNLSSDSTFGSFLRCHLEIPPRIPFNYSRRIASESKIIFFFRNILLRFFQYIIPSGDLSTNAFCGLLHIPLLQILHLETIPGRNVSRDSTCEFRNATWGFLQTVLEKILLGIASEVSFRNFF